MQEDASPQNAASNTHSTLFPFSMAQPRIVDDSDEDEDMRGDSSIPQPTLQLQATISVLDTSSSLPSRLFYLKQPLLYLLRDSPPIIHPFQPLAVWPLSKGNILFANFEDNSYFVRRLRPSTSHSEWWITLKPSWNRVIVSLCHAARHIFMKCHFSPCGRYLHIAALEGRLIFKPQKSGYTPPSINLALLVTTHSLCTKKTNKSPPTLIHRVRIDIGEETGVLASKLTYTLTWSRTKLYFTTSHYKLLVYQIQLFSSEGETSNASPVLCPQNPMFLPENAENRDVYFFPSTDTSTKARIIIGNMCPSRRRIPFGQDFEPDLLKMVDGCFQRDCSPPIGCFVCEEADLGGWTSWDGHTKIRENYGIGQLNHLLEKFNPDDDCDCEFLPLHNSTPCC